MTKTYKTELVYPELSYQIIRVLFDVFTNLGPGHKENQYQKAIEIALKDLKIKHKREVPCKLY